MYDQEWYRWAHFRRNWRTVSESEIPNNVINENFMLSYLVGVHGGRSNDKLEIAASSKNC